MMRDDELAQVIAKAVASKASDNGAAQKNEVADEVQLRYEILRSRVLSADQLETLPPPVPQIEGYCSADTIMSTIGRPGTAKTLIAMSMAFAVDTGQPWFGHPVRQGPVLYVVGEGTAGLGQRQRAWREACGWPALVGMHWLPMAVNLLDPSWSAGLVRLVEDVNPVFVVVDTVARSMPGGDENSSMDMGALVDAADRIRQAAHCTVDLVHHTPKEGSTPRGHSALEGAVDTVLLLERNGSQFTLTAAKQKDLPSAEPLVFELAQVGSSVVPVLKVLPNGLGSTSELVGAELTVHDLVWQCSGSTGLASTALLRMSGLPERTFYRALNTLVDKGVVHNAGTKSHTLYVAVREAEQQVLPVLPSTANTAVAVLPKTTAKPPLLRGLAVVAGSGSDSALDLDEAPEEWAAEQDTEAW
jgi:hypothetical protein